MSLCGQVPPRSQNGLAHRAPLPVAEGHAGAPGRAMPTARIPLPRRQASLPRQAGARKAVAARRGVTATRCPRGCSGRPEAREPHDAREAQSRRRAVAILRATTPSVRSSSDERQRKRPAGERAGRGDLRTLQGSSPEPYRGDYPGRMTTPPVRRAKESWRARYERVAPIYGDGRGRARAREDSPPSAHLSRTSRGRQNPRTFRRGEARAGCSPLGPAQGARSTRSP
jgi:hypothetical protein